MFRSIRIEIAVKVRLVVFLSSTIIAIVQLSLYLFFLSLSEEVTQCPRTSNLFGSCPQSRQLSPTITGENTSEHGRLQDYGPHEVERAPHATSDNRCVVCLEKHNRVRQQNPCVTYKDLPKTSKTVYWCNYCKVFLCVGVPQQYCWQDWHAKVQFWR
uniref:Uncharacterized protein n=1 Tax=Octopus bimaculoides TaxID=37653 RepID=A0A0L8H7R0_OCTBM